MKFSEIGEESWPDLQPYLDTCFLPLSGLTGEESPWDATEKIARTGEWLVPLEQAFRGRTVTMPAYHYNGLDNGRAAAINRLIRNCRSAGFRYVVVVSGHPLRLDEPLEADLVVQPESDDEQPEAAGIGKSVADLWRKPSSAPPSAV
ncbi:DUF2487 family protein [Cohnella suwonensis]|uniref:DUF2487 family protein n=1 Tax=Cohnella suwonensis TaxID=696072 RepID=A0ABW0LPU8_9BACL